ncbi:MgtC/SapB family protein [Aerococcaceae bacterium zg-B36]|uniref:MgtC/SapB family protein n=1 Tax=Aerococcaceae bacterium zg-252 TaxID=2796928 RepID=UPI001BD8E21B|nr:MgtC/SapB family protein [Aerococcaceae bacterium zg-B36]
MRASIDLHSLNFWSINIRIILAVLIGGIIGVERAMKNHTAGFRTHILVCLGATLVMMTNIFIHEKYGESDPSRMAAQVISGIGFLGAGTILVTKYNQVKGLTTAAGLWTAACVGLAIGIGFYVGALATAVSIILIMTLFQRLKKNIEMRSLGVDCYIVFEHMDSFKEFLVYCTHRGWVVKHVEKVEAKPHQEGKLAYSMTVDMNESKEHEYFVRDVAVVNGIIEVEEYF